jgi:hypothetical protein
MTMSGFDGADRSANGSDAGQFLDPSQTSNPPTRPGGRKEYAVYPGIYFTPGIANNGKEQREVTGRAEGQSQSFTDIALLSREALIFEERELSKVVAKLKSSNDEMVEFDPDAKDSDLVDARRENEAVIKRSEERLETMRKRLEILECISK